MTLHAFEDNAIDDVAKGDDEDHDGDDGAHIVQVAAHHQNLSEAEAEVEHFGGDQRAPRERPALLQTRDDEGQGWPARERTRTA